MIQVIKLTEFSWDKEPKSVLIGVESIIKAEECEISWGDKHAKVTKIKSRGAMVETTYVTEPLMEIYSYINLNRYR